MTRDEILNMPAGREMDALVAERVMGWTLRRDGIYVNDPNDTSMFGSLWGTTYDAPYVFNPSEDIAAAWQVVEKMQQEPEEYYFELTCTVAVYPGYWYATFGDRTTWGDTCPLAICRAALLAVMEL